jgi:hypothetical protein
LGLTLSILRKLGDQDVITTRGCFVLVNIEPGSEKCPKTYQAVTIVSGTGFVPVYEMKT